MAQDEMADERELDPQESSARPNPILLERIEPSVARGEEISLDARRAAWRVGRSERSEIRLYTTSASREHALISANGQGGWLITPCPGKQVSIDGEPTSIPVLLEPGMNLVLGGDHLRCAIEAPAPSPPEACIRADGPADRDATRPRRASLRRRLGFLVILGVTLFLVSWTLEGPRPSQLAAAWDQGLSTP